MLFVHPSWSVRDSNLKYRLCEINGDRRMLHVDSSSLWPLERPFQHWHDDAVPREESIPSRDTRLGRTVAIKVLPEHVAADPDLKQRFERTAELGSRDAAGKWYAATSHAEIVVSMIVSSERRRIVSLVRSAGIVAAVVCVSAVHGLLAVGGPAAASSASGACTVRC